MRICMHRHSIRGFTLVELILTMVIMSILFAFVGTIMYTGLKSYSLVSDRQNAISKARMALNLMADELVVISNPATDITSISSTSITFVSAEGESVTYSISSQNLMRDANILTDNVGTGTGFTYYTAGGGTTSTPSQVHRIKIDLAVNADASVHGVIRMTESIYLRNRYYNGFTKL